MHPPESTNKDAGGIWSGAGRFFGLLLQLGLMLIVSTRFQIESTAFRYMLCFAIVGFAINYFLPQRYRLAFFVLLSLSAIGFILGLTLGAWLIGLGLILISICHLPIPLVVRVSLLVAIGIVFGLMSQEFITAPWTRAIWPILGSMFMFRLIVYLYDIQHGAPTSVTHALSYFFLLPNVCFPLFPVIDYKTFCRTHYDEERHQIYQVGATWMWRGIVQLIVYRYVYYYVVMDPLEVTNVGELAGYMISTFLLYIRISGQFHLIVGILHLFGFNLPESHRCYYLSSSFTDFWRRINIYWKDFMMKVVYYPMFFRMRKWKPAHALVVATLITFVATWFLHAYQWFWLRGTVFLELHDLIFWSILAVLVVINALYEMKYGRKRSLGNQQQSLPGSIWLVSKTLGTFTLICVLWSFWSAESVLDWWWMCRDAMALPAITTETFLYVLLACVALLVIVIAIWKGWSERLVVTPRTSMILTIASGIVLCVVSLPTVNERLGRPGEIIASLRKQHLNRRDAQYVMRGYYENLLAFGRFSNEVNDVFAMAERQRGLQGTGLANPTTDLLFQELVPNASTQFWGQTVTINRWGMRDIDYEKDRPPNVCRMVLIGSSHEMGSGVGDGETFESLVEARVNRQLIDAECVDRFELLNFAVGSYSPIQQLYMLESRAFEFQPHVVVYAGHSVDQARLLDGLLEAISGGVEIPYPVLEDLIRDAKVDSHTGINLARRRLTPHVPEILSWLYGRIADQCRERGITPVFLYLPSVTDLTQPWRSEMHDDVVRRARAADFVVWDLDGLYAGRDIEKYWVRPNDPHANAAGNQLIADRMMEHVQNLLRSEWPPFQRVFDATMTIEASR